MSLKLSACGDVPEICAHSDCYKRALGGDTHACAQVVAIQSIAYNGLLV
jgi:hypothetical protein